MPESEVDLVEIDETKLNELMEACRTEYPNVPEYFIYTLCVDHLMTGQE